jgi:hypothetical protein
MKTPLAQVKEKFNDKAKLVAAVQKLAGDDLWIDRTNKNKGLGHVSNAKLIRLHDTFSAVKEKFGTRDKLIGAILDIEKRTKDDGYKTRLAKYPVPRLWDMYRSLEKRSAPPKSKAPKGPRNDDAKPKAAKPAAAPAKKPSGDKPKKAASKKS